MTTVIKLGGSLLDRTDSRWPVLDGIVAAAASGERIVIVHGGGRHIDRELSLRGIERRTVNGLRITDAATLEVVTATLAGGVNTMLVGELLARGVRAAGLSGVDGRLIVGRTHPPVNGTDLGHVGLVESVDAGIVDALATAGYMPVIACLGADASGQPLNVNADSAASAIAIALRARRIIYLTDVEGYLRADGSVAGEMTLDECNALINSGELQGGMYPKLVSVAAALAGGVAEARIAGGTHHPRVLIEGTGGTRLAAA